MLIKLNTHILINPDFDMGIMLEPIRISRNWRLETQIYAEMLYDQFAKFGLYEKTIDEITREPVYFPLLENL